MDSRMDSRLVGQSDGHSEVISNGPVVFFFSVETFRWRPVIQLASQEDSLVAVRTVRMYATSKRQQPTANKQYATSNQPENFPFDLLWCLVFYAKWQTKPFLLGSGSDRSFSKSGSAGKFFVQADLNQSPLSLYFEYFKDSPMKGVDIGQSID